MELDRIGARLTQQWHLAIFLSVSFKAIKGIALSPALLVCAFVVVAWRSSGE